MSDRCCICFESANTVPVPCCNGVMHYACWNRWMQLNPTCPLCRRPQSLEDTLMRQMAGLSVVYDILDYENGPFQVVGELGPSPGRLAHNSRANVARRVLATMDNMLDRTRTEDTDFRRISMERDTFQDINHTLRDDNRYLRSELDTLRVYFRASNAENIQLNGQAANLRLTVVDLRRELRVWRVVVIVLTVVVTVLSAEIVRNVFD